MDIKPCQKNKDEYPDDEVLARYLGKTKKAWDSFMNILEKDFPLFDPQWRYYNDGKSWLLKVVKKKKTICWVTVFDGLFKTTFYFTDKAAELINTSNLDTKYKDQYKNGKYYGKIKAISIELKNPSDLEMTKILIGIKEQIK